MNFPVTRYSIKRRRRSGQGQLTISWDVVTGASKYYLYRSTSSNGTYTKIGGNIDTVYYTDTGLSASTTYYYKVAAVNAGGEGAPSSAVSASTPGKPTGSIGAVTVVKDIDTSHLYASFKATANLATSYTYGSTTNKTGQFNDIGPIGAGPNTFKVKASNPFGGTDVTKTVNVTGAGTFN